jgi:excisionase family DNA binding protein
MNAIILSNEELEQKINERVSAEFQKRYKVTEKRKTNLDIHEAINYLNELGYKCSQSQMYKLTMKNEIPFSKFGRLISFNATDLEKWVETKKRKTVDVSLSVSKSANSKLGR